MGVASTDAMNRGHDKQRQRTSSIGATLTSGTSSLHAVPYLTRDRN